MNTYWGWSYTPSTEINAWDLSPPLSCQRTTPREELTPPWPGTDSPEQTSARSKRKSNFPWPSLTPPTSSSFRSLLPPKTLSSRVIPAGEEWWRWSRSTRESLLLARRYRQARWIDWRGQLTLWWSKGGLWTSWELRTSRWELNRIWSTCELEVFFGKFALCSITVVELKSGPETLLGEIFGPADSDHPTDCSLMHFLRHFGNKLLFKQIPPEIIPNRSNRWLPRTRWSYAFFGQRDAGLGGDSVLHSTLNVSVLSI